MNVIMIWWNDDENICLSYHDHIRKKTSKGVGAEAPIADKRRIHLRIISKKNFSSVGATPYAAQCCLHLCMQASPSALNTPQRTSFDVPTPLKIKRAPILGARKKGKAQKNLRTQLSTKSRPTFFSAAGFFLLPMIWKSFSLLKRMAYSSNRRW